MYVWDATTFKQTPCSCTLIENCLLSCFSLSLFFFSQFHKLYQSSHLTILYILKDKLSFWQQSSGKSKLKYREIRSKMTVFIARVANMVKKKSGFFKAEPCELQCHIYKQYTSKWPEPFLSAWKSNIHLPGNIETAILWGLTLVSYCKYCSTFYRSLAYRIP